MIPEIKIPTGKSPFGSLFIVVHQANWFILAVARNEGRVFSGKVVVIVRSPGFRGAERTSWQRADLSVLLHKTGVGSAVKARGPTVIVQPDGP